MALNNPKHCDVTTLKELLIAAGVKKVFVIDENTHGVLLLGVCNDSQYLISISKGTYAWYSKIVPAHMVLEIYWKCKYILYVPEGLYVFANNVNELVSKIIRVIGKLESYKRSIT